jgi:organic hydroperoxide reductase OsmC/OhrA
MNKSKVIDWNEISRLGFAAALEIVPALILSALRPTPAQERASVPAAAEQEQTEEQQQERQETEQGPAAIDSLPVELLQHIASTDRGTKVAVRQVAKVLRIGSDRATRLMQKAAEACLLSKTAAGYVAA